MLLLNKFQKKKSDHFARRVHGILLELKEMKLLPEVSFFVIRHLDALKIYENLEVSEKRRESFSSWTTLSVRPKMN